MTDTTTTTSATKTKTSSFQYMTGFGNELQSEILPGAVPVHRNNPRIVPYNLLTEQISGTAFTISPRSNNARTWMYRLEPSVSGRAYSTSNNENITEATSSTDAVDLIATVTEKTNKRTMEGMVEYPYFGGCNPKDCVSTIEPIRWDVPPPPFPHPQYNTADCNREGRPFIDFIKGSRLMCTAGDVGMKQGINIYMYSHVNTSMDRSSNHHHICNADGDFLIVPQQGSLVINTELGRIGISPKEICVIPRGIVFQVVLGTETSVLENGGDNDEKETITSKGSSNIENNEDTCRGYILEISTAGYGFQLPDLGPIGSNGLANARDFQIPVAWCPVSTKEEYYSMEHHNHIVYTKTFNQLVPSTLHHTPYNVIGWYGNYVPYKYNLQHFCAINSVSYDHIDPSIYTVLTCPSNIVQGVALADFVIFPPRMIATDPNTFRPPWFHKNTMSEYMGLIYGTYDAKVGKATIDENTITSNATKTSVTADTKHEAKKKRICGGGFVPGGASLHNCMVPHGPDTTSYVKAVADSCDKPIKLDTGMAFMFETYLPLRVAPTALLDKDWRDMSYNECWHDGDGLTAAQFTGWDALQLLQKHQTTRSNEQDEQKPEPN